MPRVPGCDAVYEVANQWRDRCLVSDGSLLWPDHDKPTWTVANLESARDSINELVHKNTNTGGDMERQFREEPEEIKRVVADASAIWNLCPGSIGIEGRKEFVRFVAGWVDSPPLLDDVNTAIQANIGGKESAWFRPGFQIQRGAHLRFIFEFGRRLKVEKVDPFSYFDVRSLTHSIQQEYPRSASAKNMVLHLLFPDETEPIFNNWARDRIAEAPEFSKFVREASDLDDALAAIRRAYATKSGHQDFDFYDPEFREIWRPSDGVPELGNDSSHTSKETDHANEEGQFWWVNQGRSFDKECRGGYIFARGQSRSGAPLKHHQLLREMRKGDWIIHYSQGAVRAVGQVASEVCSANHDDLRVEVDYKHLIQPITLDKFPQGLIQRGNGPFDRNGSVKQQYAFRLHPEFVNGFVQSFRGELPVGAFDVTIPPPPDLSNLSAHSNLGFERLLEIEALIFSKRQIILEGPPGSGKTYVARLFARYLAGLPLDRDHDEHVEIVQFHQSYGYEDFVAGIRPATSETGTLTYETRPGVFVEMCNRAATHPDETFVLIIDEINRGNLSRIFGELLYGLEYRDQPVRMQYPVQIGNETTQHLTIPDNLYLIGTMNSTDRSLALIDYALRRRFYFWRLMPVEGNDAPVLRRWLESQPEIDPADRAELLQAFITLNTAISQELGLDYQIGHSYFMLDDGEIDDPVALERVWTYAIEPLLREYFHTRRHADAEIERLGELFFGLSTTSLEDFNADEPVS